MTTKQELLQQQFDRLQQKQNNKIAQRKQTDIPKPEVNEQDMTASSFGINDDLELKVLICTI